MSYKDFKLTDDNYFNEEASRIFCGSSQFRSFQRCEASALAEVNGWQRPKSDALIQGGFVDAYFSGELEQFAAEHPELFKKDGTLLAKYESLNKTIAAIERQPLMMYFLSGEKQTIMTGEISGVPFKIKMDSYKPNEFIADLKCTRSFAPMWVDEAAEKLPWFFKWGYDIQGAIYREIVRQNTGITLPFYIVAATKEETPDVELIEIVGDDLDRALEIVKEFAPRYDAVKQGLIEPIRCGGCDFCKETKKIDRAIRSDELI